MTVSLTGFMGCGKSSVGKRLSALLCCPFIDLDEYIVAKYGKSINEMFSDGGETFFRQQEEEALYEILDGAGQDEGRDLVLALGGGTMTSPRCASAVRNRSLCIYLKASPETLARNLSGAEAGKRPLLAEAAGQGHEAMVRQISLMLDRRGPTYMKYAHIVTDTDGKSIEETAGLIADLVRSCHPFHACP